MNYLLSILINFASTSIVGLASHLSISMSGIVFLGLPTVAKISAYTLGILDRHFPLSISLIVAIIVAFVVALFFSSLHVKLSSDTFAVVGLSSILATESLILSLDSITGGVNGINEVASEISLQIQELTILSLLSLTFLLLLQSFLFKTPFFLKLKAIKEAPFHLESLGISSNKTYTEIILISSILITVSAFLTILKIHFIEPKSFGIFLLIDLLAISTLAFKAKLTHVLFASSLITFLPEFFRFLNLPESSFASLRIILNSLVLIIILQKLSKSYTPQKRTI